MTVESWLDQDEIDPLKERAPLAVVRSLRDNPDFVKCPRCWHYHGVLLNFDCLCDRCCNTLLIDHPDHPSVPFIKASQEQQKRYFARISRSASSG